MNKVVLIGRLTKDPDLRYTPNGAAVCNFTVACDKRDKEGNKDADFIQCTTWNKTAENLAKYKAKGDQIAIEGALEVSSYEKDGQKRWITQVNAHTIEFIGGGKNNGGNNTDNAGGWNASNNDYTADGAMPYGQPVEFRDSDLPF